MTEAQGRSAGLRTAAAVFAVLGIVAVGLAATVVGVVEWWQAGPSWEEVDAPLGRWTLLLPGEPDFERSTQTDAATGELVFLAAGAVDAGNGVRISVVQSRQGEPSLQGPLVDSATAEALRRAAEQPWDGSTVTASNAVSGTAGSGHVARAELADGGQGRSYAVANGTSESMLVVLRAGPEGAEEIDDTFSRVLRGIDLR